MVIYIFFIITPFARYRHVNKKNAANVVVRIYQTLIYCYCSYVNSILLTCSVRFIFEVFAVQETKLLFFFLLHVGFADLYQRRVGDLYARILTARSVASMNCVNVSPPVLSLQTEGLTLFS